MLSPSGEASVCPGDQLSFTCSTNLTFLEWNITTFQSGTSRRQIMTAISQSNVQLIINGHSFSITRTSDDGSYPIVSKLVIANVPADLTINSTRIRCTGQEVGHPFTENSTSVAVIHVIRPNLGIIRSRLDRSVELLYKRLNSVPVG